MAPSPAFPPRRSARAIRVPTILLGASLFAAACTQSVIGDPARPSGHGGAGGTTGGGSGGAAVTDGGVRPAGDAADAAGPGRGPTPARTGLRFPFPQNRESSNCVYPHAYRNEDVQAAFDQWKRDTITSDGAGGFLRVKRLESDPVLETGSTVSEGIGYGMLIAVYMGDQMLFDQLWKYEQKYLDENGLMDWNISADGSKRLGTGAATDADEDMAFALLMADKQWGGQGMLDKPYLQHAKDQIKKVWDHEVFESKLARAGDSWGDWNSINISYFAPAYYRLFERVDGNTAGWDAVIKTVYDTIDKSLNAANGNVSNGLVPAWCNGDGQPSRDPKNYQYDSCRTPFRIALDWCWFDEPRAKAYVAKTSTFFGGIGAQNIADGYALDGTPQAANPGKGSAAFVGPAGVGAMSAASFQPFLDQAYSAVATGTLLAGGTYYEDSWTVMSLLMMTGNFLDYTAY